MSTKPKEEIIRISELIAPAFYAIFKSIINHDYTHYWFPGGRGSTKSSNLALATVILIVQNPDYNAVILRATDNTLRDSVYAKIRWAIQMLHMTEFFTFKVSPLEITYKPTGQQILFRGCDNPERLKGINFQKGYAAIVWFEELAEFKSIEFVTSINQTLLRGGAIFYAFYSYNPPASVSSWVNYTASIPRQNKVVHKSTYLDVPPEWLGPAFIEEAEAMKHDHPDLYRHQYLGEVTGTGGEVFRNVTADLISDDEISYFQNIRIGLDWGYASDPTAIVVGNYDSKKKILTIFNEYYAVGASNETIAEILKRINPLNRTVICDSAEPKSIAYLNSLGIRAVPVKKYPGSRQTGYKFISQSISIRIDPDRAPNAYRELSTYELQKDRFGNFKPEYPDGNDHCCDAISYMLSDMIPGSNKPITPFKFDM